MESSERLRRNTEIEELCDVVDKRVERLLGKLNANRDANLIKQVQDEMRRVIEYRAKARSEYENKLHELDGDKNTPAKKLSESKEYSAFLIYRSFLSVYHTAVSFLIQEWRDNHSLADWDKDCDT
jgi:hypothetical protein